MSDNEVPSGTFGDYSPTNANAVPHPSNYEICDKSGFRFPAGTLVKQWDGLMVHPRYLDHRHPQEFVRGVPERPRPSVRPEQPDEFVGGGLFYLLTEDGEYLGLESGDGYQLLESATQVSADNL